MSFRRFILSLVTLLLVAVVSRAQFSDCSTGLLQMPTADMQADGTFMITNNFLNKHSLSPQRWGYNTFQYGIYVSFWERIEIGYVCTIMNGAWDPRPEEEKSERLRILRNQDRHFVGRVCLLREGEFGLNWMPALVVGVVDPTTGAGGGEYISGDVSGTGNGFFNRNYVVLTKHFMTQWAIWLQHHGILDEVNVIAEYDSRTVNIGFVASIWENRFEAMFELQNFRWVNFGLRYKLRIKKN